MNTQPLKKLISINIGNTNLSVSSNKTKKIISNSENSQEVISTITTWSQQSSNTYFLLCNVLSVEDSEAKYPCFNQLLEQLKLQNAANFIDIQQFRKTDSFLGMQTLYSESLGMDRLIQSYNLWKKLQSQKLNAGIIIDAGTMTTIDIVSSKKGHLGGYIMPGFHSFANTFQQAKKLPRQEQLLESLAKTPSLELPKNTTDAISLGYWHSYVKLLHAVIKEYGIDTIITSGGDGRFWHQNLATNKLPSHLSCTNNILFPHESLWQIGEDVLK